MVTRSAAPPSSAGEATDPSSSSPSAKRIPVPAPRVLLAAFSPAVRAEHRTLLPEGLDIEEAGGNPSETRGRLPDPDIVLLEAGDLGDARARWADSEALPMVIAVAAGPEEAVASLEAGASDVILASEPLALRKRRVARAIELHSSRTREALLHAVLDCIDTGTVVSAEAEPHRPILYANAAFERMTGWKASEVIGQNARLLQGPETDPRAVEEMRAALAARRPCRVLIRNYRKDGTPFWNDLILSAVRPDGRKVSHWVGVQHDVSELMQARELATHRFELEELVESRTRELADARRADSERRQFIEAVLDEITAAVLAVDDQGDVVLANRAALQILEVSLETCIGAPLDSLLGPVPELISAMASARPGEEYRLDISYLSPSGRTLHLGTTVIAADEVGPPRQGEPIPGPFDDLSAPGSPGTLPVFPRFLLVFRDLGVKEQLEMELRRVRALAALGEMAAGFAHEIRNPLAAIRSLVELLLSELPESDEKREYIERILRLLGRLERLVRTSMRFAQPKAPAPRKHEAGSLVAEALDVLTPRLGARGARPQLISSRPVPTVYVDSDQVVELLVILVSNALDAANDPAGVVVAVGPAGAEDGVPKGSFVVVTVVDDGPGIPGDLQTRIFDPFFTTKAQGTGLGLSIAQGLAKQNRAHLRLSSRPGETRFSLLLPVGPS